MAEDSEGVKGPEHIVKKPEALKQEIQVRTRGVLDRFIDKNPVVKEQGEALNGIITAMPEGRLKNIAKMGNDILKIPRAGIVISLETIKTIMPVVRLALFVPEKLVALGTKVGGKLAGKVIESRPAQFAMGTVEKVMDRILGDRGRNKLQENVVAVGRGALGDNPVGRSVRQLNNDIQITAENAHQILVGMARPKKV